MSTLTLKRRFAADPETVFDFVTKPENLVKWWGIVGATLPEHNLDFTKPGPWYCVMISPMSGRLKVSGEVTAYDRPNSVEFTWAWHDEYDQPGRETLVRFEVTPDGPDASEFCLYHSGLENEESVAQHKIGWISTLSKLEQII
ncbi:MAG: SRPBCC domain-containing protein [Alphaproteobacteria bacterium]|nr:MAG: SRPBCC domain-containing protein [Alphaproteobacteria bacterium]